MKKQILLGLLALIPFACVVDNRPPGPPKEMTYDLESFEEIEVGHAMKVEIVQSSRSRVRAKGVQRDIDDLRVRVSGSTLHIGYDQQFSNSNREELRLRIETPHVRALSVSGACNAGLVDFDNINDLSIDVSGAANLFLDSEIENLEADLSGASEVKLVKDLRALKVEASGASSLDAKNIRIGRAYIDASGGSSLHLGKLADLLEVDASGGSSIEYSGTPQVRQDLSGGASLHQD
ncbi:DUF2807 domain-containing protein [Marinilongibacter aquaticus]|uniref:DUF2807 domain-containing protein n=1 Tax=Marinilongibacter aquaticus TaxID=2975157 RepID=UPI0021BD1D89|nr:DUF2807 domain-containing protein [Marinilongibacter aquaticus]UBM60293.1 DUF2807 domain-containing protein [Marinilongibacter aquaticus]